MISSSRQGAIGALLDEYEKAIHELVAVIRGIPDQMLNTITDAQTKDDNCRSVQTILTHVVSSGYGYATSIHHLKGDKTERRPKFFHDLVAHYVDDLQSMFDFTVQVLQSFADRELEELDNTKKIKTGWGQVYDVEQLMEHAIVHVLRHRRQIQKIKQEVWKN